MKVEQVSSVVFVLTIFISLLGKFSFIHPFLSPQPVILKLSVDFPFSFPSSCYPFLLPQTKLFLTLCLVLDILKFQSPNFSPFIQILISQKIAFLNMLFIRKTIYVENKEINESSKTFPEFIDDHIAIQTQNIPFNQQFVLSVSYRLDLCASLMGKNKNLRYSLCPPRSFLF